MTSSVLGVPGRSPKIGRLRLRGSGRGDSAERPMSTIGISLPDSLRDFVDLPVSRTGYGTSSEYVRDLKACEHLAARMLHAYWHDQHHDRDGIGLPTTRPVPCGFVQSLDLQALYTQIRAVEGWRN